MWLDQRRVTSALGQWDGMWSLRGVKGRVLAVLFSAFFLLANPAHVLDKAAQVQAGS